MTDPATNPRSSAESFTVFGHTYTALPGHIPGTWRDAAFAAGYTLLGRARDETTCVVDCQGCGEMQLARIDGILTGLPPCPACREARRVSAMAILGAQLASYHPGNADGAVFQLGCGHPVHLPWSRIEVAAAGGAPIDCDGCRENRYAEIARGTGLELVGPSRSGDPEERLYRHRATGQLRDLTPREVYWRRLERGASPREPHEGSTIYLLDVPLKSSRALKLGASEQVRERVFQLGRTLPFDPEHDHVTPMPRPDVALREEHRLHDWLRSEHPDLVVPPAEIGLALRCVTEVYRSEAYDLIRAKLDEIAARYRDYDGRYGLLAPG